MTRETLVAVLQKHPFVEEFQPQHIEKLAALAKEVQFERDHVIFHEGDECHDFYLIVQGRVALEIEAPGHTFRVQTLRAGDELGWSAILMGRGKHFQARALQPRRGAGVRRRGAARRVPGGPGLRLRADVPDAGRRVRAAAGHKAAGAGHVFAGGEARGNVIGALPPAVFAAAARRP